MQSEVFPDWGDKTSSFSTQLNELIMVRAVLAQFAMAVRASG